MCLILFAYKVHPEMKLIMAANRDEFYERPTARMSWWEDAPNILAGRDLQAGGTWMGVSREGRLAALTNYREPGNLISNAPSRGALVTDFLTGAESPEDYLASLHSRGSQYNGYNLLTGTPDSLCYHSNRAGKPSELEPGIYGLSNHILDTPWPKVRSGKSTLKNLLDISLETDPWFEMLQNPAIAPDSQLPDTRISTEWERMLSAMFIESESYGTRVSSLLMIDNQNNVYFEERAYMPNTTPVIHRFTVPILLKHS